MDTVIIIYIITRNHEKIETHKKIARIYILIFRIVTAFFSEF